MGDLRRSKYDCSPRIMADGEPYIPDITDADVARFRALSNYDFLTADYLAALTGSSSEYTTDRMNELKLEPKKWVELPEALTGSRHSRHNHIYDALSYSLSERSIERLKKVKHKINNYGFSGPYVHRLMSQWIRCGFDLAEQEGALQVIPFHEIKANERTPEKTRKSNTAHHIPVSFRFRGEHLKKDVVPDTHPFAVRTNGVALLLLESDCNSEDKVAKHTRDIDTKFHQYIEIFRQGIILERYGFGTAYVLFVTTDEPHMRSLMRHLYDITVDDKRWRKRFLFKSHPSLTSDEKPRATGHVATEPWHRAGLPMFDLLTGTEVESGH